MEQAPSSVSVEFADQLGPEARAAPGAKEWSHHPVDIRLSIPLLLRRYYVTIVAGPERRNAARRVSERRKHPLLRAGNILFLLVFGTITGLVGLNLIQFATLMFLRQNGLVELWP